VEKPDSQNSSSTDEPVSFRDRFAFHKWDVVPIIIVLLLVGVRVVVRGSHASEGILGRPLRVGIVSWPGYAGGLVANNGLLPNKDSDFWKNHNLLVEFVLVEDEVELRSSFERGGENGGLDVMWSTVDSLAHQLPDFTKTGVQPRAFMQVDWSRGGDAMVASAEIRRIEDLRDKTVAVSISASQWLLEYSLMNSSLTDTERTAIQQMRLQTKSSPEAREQFVSGKVDAAVLWEPNVSQALKMRDGSHILVDSTIAANLIADVMVAKQDFIRQNREAIKAFIKGWFEGTRRAINDPMLAVKVLQEEKGFTEFSEEDIRKLLGKVAWTTLEDNVQMFGLAGSHALFDELFNGASSLWYKRRYITDKVGAEQAREAGPLKEIHSAQRGSSGQGPACGLEIMTKELAAVFPPGKTELSEETRRVLDDDEVSLLFRTYSEARFCVQVGADEEKDPRRALDISRARANAVIEYLAKHYDRRWSQFMSEAVSPDGSVNGKRPVGYIRLKVVKRAGD
jgi:NitT/TauT family transport system substrate-binding protein